MKIDRIDVFEVSIPLKEPWQTSFGIDDSTDSVMVRMHCGEEHGWGEAAPLKLPTYGSEYTTGAFFVVRDLLAPRLIGREIASGEELQRLLSVFKGNAFAKASLDLAWWDLHSRMEGRPLWRLIGGERNPVQVGEAFGIQESVDRLLARIEEAVQRGYTRVKLKYGPGSEEPVVAAVREAFPDLTLHIDCNSAYGLDRMEMFCGLDRYGLAMIEQPLARDDLLDHAELQKRITTPICLDESITSPRKARQAIAIGACRWINIKTGRLGGLTPALEVHRICREAGVPCWIGSMLDSSVGTSFGLALATLSAVAYPSDLLPSSRFFASDLGRPEITLSGPSRISLSERPGIGVEPDAGQLESRTIRKAVVEAQGRGGEGYDRP